MVCASIAPQQLCHQLFAQVCRATSSTGLQVVTLHVHADCLACAGTCRKLCEDSLAVAGLQAGQVGMVCGGEADAGHIYEAAAVI